MTRVPDPLVSVVIATRNGASHIAAQLEALSAQELDAGFEVVVADNGSEDATVDIVRSFADRLDLRIVDAGDRRGVSTARNAGVAAARGAQLIFLDDDDVIAPGYVAALSRALEETEFVAARVDVRALNPPWCLEMREVDRVAGLRRAEGFSWALGCALGMRREVFDRVGGFDETLRFAGDDVELCRRMHRSGYELRLVEDAVVHRRLRTTKRALFSQGRRYALGAVTPDGNLALPMLSGLPGAARLALLGRSRGQRARGAFLLGRVVGRIERKIRRVRNGALVQNTSRSP